MGNWMLSKSTSLPSVLYIGRKPFEGHCCQVVGDLTLQAVHNHIQLPLRQQRLQLVRPQALSTELVQRRRLVLVSHGRHGVDGILPLRPCLFQRRLNDVCLYSRKHRSPRANVDDGEL